MTATERRNTFLPNNAEPTREKKWKAPETGWLKVNWDASFSKNQGLMGFGAVVRDETGMVMAAQCKSFVGFLDPTVAEARAALMAIQLCRKRSLMPSIQRARIGATSVYWWRISGVTCRCSSNGGCLIYVEKGTVLPIHYPSLLQLTLRTFIGSLNPLIVLRIL
jgi:hypothetical protein